jgi:hypothetical protein
MGYIICRILLSRSNRVFLGAQPREYGITSDCFGDCLWLHNQHQYDDCPVVLAIVSLLFPHCLLPLPFHILLHLFVIKATLGGGGGG